MDIGEITDLVGACIQTLSEPAEWRYIDQLIGIVSQKTKNKFAAASGGQVHDFGPTPQPTCLFGSCTHPFVVLPDDMVRVLTMQSQVDANDIMIMPWP